MIRLISFTRRNLLIYLKNKFQIFFSILTSIIVIMLYLLFLKKSYTEPLISALNKMHLYILKNDISLLSDILIISSTVILSTITIPFTLLQTMISDKEAKIDYDIISSPLKRYEIILGYYFSAVVAGFFISSFFTILSFIYIIGIKSYAINLIVISKIIGLNLLASLSSSAIFMVLVSFINRLATASAIYGLFSAVIGFVIGAYMPLSTFSKKIQQLFLLLPQTQLTQMYKKIYSYTLLNKMSKDDRSALSTSFIKELKKAYSIEIDFFNKPLTNDKIIIYVSVFLVITLSLSIFIYHKKYKK